MNSRPRTSMNALFGVLIFCALSTAPLRARQAPPASPPAEWGPISINLEEIEYPHPVRYLNLNLYGQDVRIAYMDVAPQGRANGRTVVLLHGGSWTDNPRLTVMT